MGGGSWKKMPPDPPHVINSGIALRLTIRHKFAAYLQNQDLMF